MRGIVGAGAVFVAISLSPMPVAAIQLAFADVFSPIDPSTGPIFSEGIVFDPGTGDLLVTTETPGPENKLTRLNSAGSFISSSIFGGTLSAVIGIDKHVGTGDRHTRTDRHIRQPAQRQSAVFQ
jgi:hypothetical protein